ncbi:MAG: dihydrofolate reductase [Chitinophagaceae bacterium]|nr:dihydrofolate reductase [Chitinophagaceae bacterium]
MILSHVVAAAENNAIGKNNQLLWHLPNDLKFFKNATWALPVLMGRKTFEALSGKPLNGRVNMVMTKQKDWKAEGVVTVHTLADAVFFAKENGYNQLQIIGGGEIYKETLSKTNRLYITRVHASLEGDAYYPEFDKKDWQLVHDDAHPADEKHAYAYSFQTWMRK